MSTKYSVAEGHVLRGTEKVAAYDQKTGLLDFLPGKSNYRAPVVRFLKDGGLPVEVKPDPAPGTATEPRATRAGVNTDRPNEGTQGGEKPPEEPRPEAIPEAPAPAPSGPAKIGDTAVDTIKVAGKPAPYRSRLTPEGWV